MCTLSGFRLVFCAIGFLALTKLATDSSTGGQSGVPLRGIVKDQGDSYVSGVVVQLFSQDLILETRTGEDGKFEFPQVPAGIYRLEAWREAFKLLAVPVLEIGDRELNPLSLQLQIAPTHSECGAQPRPSFQRVSLDSPIAGVVTQWLKAPPLPADVFVTRENGTEILGKVRANEKGEFRFTGLPPGRYVLRAWHAGHYDARTEAFLVTHTNTSFIRISMHREGMVFLCG